MHHTRHPLASRITRGVDIPVFHLDWLNNRTLIAVIAILHVVINHAMAVGGIPLIVLLEKRALDTGDAAWDALARRLLTFFFVITTTVGAMTGVGIWFSAALVNPYAIGSLIRVFFWTWFVEWLVFVTEVVLILIYFQTWKTWTGPKKRAHVKLGAWLALASWLTMALIVSILSFMMDPGAWHSDQTLFSGMLNPVYLPQLAFRTPLAMVMAGAMGLALIPWMTERGALREEALQRVGKWTLAWSLPLALGGYWYAHAIPDGMAALVPIAMLTQQLAAWAENAKKVVLVAALLMFVIALLATLWPRRIPRIVLLVPTLTSILLLGTFERVREFVRKPYAIGGYMYSNGIRVDAYPMLQRDGLLTHATYASVHTVTPENEQEAGREVFRLACTRCHTTDGINGIRGILTGMYGEAPWDAESISSYVATMHNARPYMPPFPGNEAERDALAVWLVTLQTEPVAMESADATGAIAPSLARSE